MKTATLESDIFKYSLILLVVIFIGIVYILLKHYQNRTRRLRDDLELSQELVDTITTSQAILEQQHNDILNSGSDNIDNLTEVMGQFNFLIEKIPLYEKHPRKFINEFKKLIHYSDVVNPNTFINDIVNRQFSGAIDTLKNRYELKPYEVLVICMVCMGFSNNAMRVAFEHTNSNTIYSYKSALKNKLSIPIERHQVIEFLKTMK